MPRYIHIDGDAWQYVEDFSRKDAARNAAAKLRTQGWQARVVKRSWGWVVAKN